MNHKKSFGTVICNFVCLTLCTGCVTTVTVRDEPRCMVRFASATAAQTFYEAYITRNYTRSMSTQSIFEVDVPAELPYQHMEYVADNVYFNAAVAAADTNHDGVISEEEARQYSNKVRTLLQSGHVAVSTR